VVAQPTAAMAFFTRSLQDLDLRSSIQGLCNTSATKKEKVFKLYVSSYVHNYEGKIGSDIVCVLANASLVIS